eukprot:m.357056 g.357056  ORF g.357056 m.357056 type:complete len:105 (+) comp19935_c2_seq4:418-732(+)
MAPTAPPASSPRPTGSDRAVRNHLYFRGCYARTTASGKKGTHLVQLASLPPTDSNELCSHLQVAMQSFLAAYGSHLDVSVTCFTTTFQSEVSKSTCCSWLATWC